MWQLEGICTSDSGTLSSSDAINLTDQLDKQKHFSKAEAEKFFTRLERDKWLVVRLTIDVYGIEGIISAGQTFSSQLGMSEKREYAITAYLALCRIFRIF